jgi:methyl-accepting chemotaxis protein
MRPEKAHPLGRPEVRFAFYFLFKNGDRTVNEWKVATRLAVLAIVLSVLLATIGGFGLWGMQRGADGMESMYEEHMQPALALGDIGNRLTSTRLSLAIAVHTTEPATLKTNLDSVATNIAEVEKLWKDYLQHVSNPEEGRLAKAFTDAKDHFVNDGLEPTLGVLRTGDLEEGRRRLIKSSGPMFVSVKQANDALQKYHVEEVKRTFAEAQSRNASLRTAFIAAISAGVCFAIIFGGWVARSVSRQLGAEPAEAAGLARRVAGGDLSVSIALRAGDETSVMAQLRGMQEGLANVVKSVRQGAELVASASEQIALGNLDLSQRTEEQASAIEQTSASMKLLGEAIRQNSDNAKHANQLASAAASIATTGGAVVGNVVETMAGINESSQRIASIVGLIDDLAFQTNILALNAAVEAARAGEMGRGFAVVAGEVRNLAHRSGQAAKEVKDLISDSVQRVDQGVGLVKDAGATMDEIVGSIQRLSALVGDISAASAEQSAGVSRISVAVSQMDEVTQQNAALVEESAAAAEHLKIQAQELVQTVAVFKLAPDEMAVSS